MSSNYSATLDIIQKIRDYLVDILPSNNIIEDNKSIYITAVDVLNLNVLINTLLEEDLDGILPDEYKMSNKSFLTIEDLNEEIKSGFGSITTLENMYGANTSLIYTEPLKIIPYQTYSKYITYVDCMEFRCRELCNK